MKVNKLRFCRLLVLFVGVIFLFTGKSIVKAAEDETITDGVRIEDINVSGMTSEEAEKAIDKYVDELKQKDVTIILNDSVVTTSLQELGLSSDENSFVEEAMNIGKTGNLVKKYKEMKDASVNGVNFNLDYKLDDEKSKQFITDNISIYDVPAKNASVQKSNGQLVYTDAVTGIKCDVDATYQNIQNAISNEWTKSDVVVDAVVVTDVPKYTTEVVKKCNTILGSYTTDYHKSTYDRKANVGNAAKLINNSVIYPGETFSCYDVMNPFTTANGYHSAGSYVSGKVVDSIGGGVCQVSTTLYNAVLKSELEIVERFAHSMTVTYVPISFDAAIAGTYKDFKFKNNTNAPILIEGIANGNTVTFNIYGEETRDVTNRTIKFESEIVSTSNPPADVITKDPTQPTTYRKVTQNAHTGYVAVMYKYIYENGKLVDKIQINKSIYNATPNYVTVGTKEEEKEEEDDKKPDKEDDKKPDKEDDKKLDKEDDKKPDKEDDKKPDKEDDKKPVKEDDKKPDKEDDKKPDNKDESEDDNKEE